MPPDEINTISAIMLKRGKGGADFLTKRIAIN